MTTLHLTPNEATVLRIILERISGCPTTSGRVHADTMLRKLEQAGEVYTEEKCNFFPVDDESGNIHFL